MAHRKEMLIPPFRYSIVESGVHRSAHPTQRNFPFLQRLGLKSILSIVLKVDAATESFATKNEIVLHHIPVTRSFDSVTLTHENAAQALEILVNPANLPCLVHCYDGTSTTGLVMLCLRKLQSISMQFAVTEFEKFQRAELAEPLSNEERLFVESFKHNIHAPPSIPPWLTDTPDDTELGVPHLIGLTRPVQEDSVDSEGEAGRPDPATLYHVIKRSQELEALALEGTF